MSTDKSASAASNVVGVLPQVAGAVAGLMVLGVFAGWREETAYYSNLGAPWFISNLTPAMLFERSANSMLVLALFAILSVLNFMQGQASVKGLRWWSIVTVILSSGLFMAGLLPESLISNNAAHACMVFGGIIMSISAGLTVGEVVARLADNDLVWNGYHVYLLYLVIWFGLMQAPAWVGESQARIDSDARTCNLPTVQIKSASLDKSLRLVTMVGNQVLLVVLADRPESSAFKVIDASEIVVISSKERIKRTQLQGAPAVKSGADFN